MDWTRYSNPIDPEERARRRTRGAPYKSKLRSGEKFYVVVMSDSGDVWAQKAPSWDAIRDAFERGDYDPELGYKKTMVAVARSKEEALGRARYAGWRW